MESNAARAASSCSRSAASEASAAATAGCVCTAASTLALAAGHGSLEPWACRRTASNQPHAALLLAPGTDPRSPHLALPSLAAYLRNAGIRTTMRDVDLEAFYAVVQPSRVAAAVDACERRFDEAPPEERATLRVLLDDADS